jgi:hypothetical protein
VTSYSQDMLFAVEPVFDNMEDMHPQLRGLGLDRAPPEAPTELADPLRHAQTVQLTSYS